MCTAFQRSGRGLALGLLGATLAAAAVRAAEDSASAPPATETVVYQIRWEMIRVAASTVTKDWIEEDGRRLMRVRIETHTVGIMKKLHPVDDVVECVMEPINHLPLRVTEKIHEKKIDLEQVTVFDHAHGVARWGPGIANLTNAYAIGPDTREMVSFLYFMRAQPLQPGQEAVYTIAANNELQQLGVKVVKPQTIDLPGRAAVPCLLLVPKAPAAPLFATKVPQRLWVSRDAHQFITRIDASAVIGSVHLLLIDVEGPGDDAFRPPPAKPAR